MSSTPKVIYLSCATLKKNKLSKKQFILDPKKMRLFEDLEVVCQPTRSLYDKFIVLLTHYHS